jgi:hypothetical protein
VQRLLVTSRDAAGTGRDVTAAARFTVSPAGIVRLEAGELIPVRNGRAVVTVHYSGQTASVQVEVRLPARPVAVSFRDQVVPVLTRAGCNSGVCHGAQSGKNGFRLSLLGYDPELDYDSLVRQAGGRRVTRIEPGASLLLLKPLGLAPHGGGIRLRPGQREYRILSEWIAEGAPGPAPEASVTGIEVTPAAAVLAPRTSQQLLVTAHYSDGESRDVTALSRFTSNHGPVATVDGKGRVTMQGVGEAVLCASFRGQVAIARLAVPYPGPLPGLARDPWAVAADANPIDRAVLSKLRRLRLVPAQRCTDAEFLRRAYLDLTGMPPSPEEATRFLDSTLPNKRTRLVDDLLGSPAYVDLWSYRLGDLLRNTRRSLGPKGNRLFHTWLREQVAANRPWDQLVRDLLTSRGSLWDVGPANFYGTASGPAEWAEVTSQEFLGVRIQCARCHDHPFDRWSQTDYYRLAAFFARMEVKSGGERGDPVVVLRAKGEVQHPKTGAVVPPGALDGKLERRQADRRADLAVWLTSRENPWFARSIANRVWKHLMGRGLVHPVDDMRATNPPSNEAALAALTEHLIRSDFDLKALIRLIATSQVYQASSATTAGTRFDETQFSHHTVHRLTAEQLLDSLVVATGVTEKFAGAPDGTRAAQLADTSVPSYLLDLFGRPARTSVCECEREDEANLAQVLHLMNGDSINEKINAPDGRLARLLRSSKPDRDVVTELFLAVLVRRPSEKELSGALQALSRSGPRKEVMADLFWALLNSREFLFNH